MKKQLLLGLSILVTFPLSAQKTKSIKSQNLVRGAYRTFDEFLSNKPSITDSFYVDSKPRTNKHWVGTYSLTPRYFKTKRKIKKIWGFCDGEKTYILHQSDYFQVDAEDGNFIFIGYDIIDNVGAGTAGAMGGAIGAGIYSAIALSKAKSTKIKYLININNGMPIYPNKSSTTQDNSVSERKLVLFRRNHNESGKPFEFIINDSIKYSFIPNSFVNLNFASNVSEVKVCYGASFENCLTVSLNEDEDKYLQCSLLEKERTPHLIELRSSKGEFDSYKPEKAQNKRGKQLGTIYLNQ